MSKARTDMNAEDKGLGQTIAAWFKPNGWAQTFPSSGPAPGVKGPHASRSFLKQRKLEPRAGFFKGLGEFNRAVAERDLIRVETPPPATAWMKGKPLTRRTACRLSPWISLASTWAWCPS